MLLSGFTFPVIKCTYNQNNRDIFIKEHVSDVRANDRSIYTGNAAK